MDRVLYTKKCFTIFNFLFFQSMAHISVILVLLEIVEIRGFDFTFTAQKMKFSIKDFISKYEQIRSFLWICLHLLKKSLMENFIFRAVILT